MLKNQKQKGMVLVFVLLVVAVLLIGGMVLMRSNYVSNNLTNNILLQQEALDEAEIGIENAARFIGSFQENQLRGDMVDSGYYATERLSSYSNKDINDNIDWDLSGASDKIKPKILEENDRGYTISYVITRMCAKEGSMESSDCITTAKSSGSDYSSKGGLVLAPLNGAVSVYYRIILRANGPRNAQKTIQVTLYR